jgi:hypothetical protein
VDGEPFAAVLPSYRAFCATRSRDARFRMQAARWFARLRKARLADEPKRERMAIYYVQTGRHEYEMERYPSAAKALQTALEYAAETEHPTIERYLAFALGESGHFAQSRALWKKLLAADPNDRELRRFAAELLFQRGQTADAMRLLDGKEHAADAMHVLEEFYPDKKLAKVEPLIERMAETSVRAKRMLAELREAQGRHAESAPLYEACLRAEDGTSGSTWRFARELARAHSRCGTVEPTSKRLRGELDAITPAKENVPDRRRLNAALACLYRAADRDVDAFAAVRAHRLLSANPASRDHDLDDYGRRALRQLLNQGEAKQFDEALALLDAAYAEGIRGPWMGAARFAVLMKAGRRKEATALLAEIEDAIDGQKDETYWLATEIEPWGFSDVCLRLFHDVLQIEPLDDSFQQHAHARLAKYHAYRKGDWKAAREHCAAVEDDFDPRHLGGMNPEQYRQIEVYIQYRAAGNDPDVLVDMLDDSRWQRQRYAVRYLATYAEKEHLAEMAEYLDKVPDWMRSELSGAIERARARLASVLPDREPVTTKDIERRLAKHGRVLWVQPDAYDEQQRWAAVAGRFVFHVDSQTGHTVDCSKALALQGRSGLTATAIAFTSRTVWVGTDHGLFAYERWAKSWNAYSVGGRHLDVQIESLTATGKALHVTARAGGKERNWRFDLRERRWDE